MANVSLSSDAEKVLAHALALPPSERASLADLILSSLFPADPRTEALWAVEAESRVTAIESGDMDTVPADEVFAEVERELRAS